MQDFNDITNLSEMFETSAFQDLELNITRAADGLPLIFLHLLERRFLANLELDPWRVEPNADHAPRPMLREIEALSKPRSMKEWTAAMPRVLSACHVPGNAFTFALQGTVKGCKIYLGGKRIAGQGGIGTEEYLAMQAGALQTYFQGLRLSSNNKLLDRHTDLAGFIRRASLFSVLTGIPSAFRPDVNHDTGEPLSLDRVIRAIGHRSYVIMGVCQPVRPGEVDTAIDTCRRLIGFVHAFTSIAKTTGRNESTSRSEQVLPEGIVKGPNSSKLQFITGLLQTVAGVAGNALLQDVNPFVLNSGINTMLNAYDGMARHGQPSPQESVTSKSGSSENVSATFLDANAEAAERILRKHVCRLETARASGLWRSAIYLATEDEVTMAMLSGALRGIASGDDAVIDQVRVLPLPEVCAREALLGGHVLSFCQALGRFRHPLGPSFDILGSCLTSTELAPLINLPAQSVPGIPLIRSEGFSLAVRPPGGSATIQLGNLLDTTGSDVSTIAIEAAMLNRHVLVTGTSGSGKTNTCCVVLKEVYENFKVPFLVIEQAKCEYHRLAHLDSLKGILQCYSIGSGPSLSLRINPFDWVRGISLSKHIKNLKAIFIATLFRPRPDSPLPYLVEDALYQVYQDLGWDDFTSSNLYSDVDASRSALLPTLSSFGAKLNQLIQQRGYDVGVTNTLQAYVDARLRSVFAGIKGQVFNTRRSIPLNLLFERPTVITLKDAGDEDEKAFIMAILVTLLYEYAETRVARLLPEEAATLQHITVIEEAHRLLKAIPPGGSASADLVATATLVFCDMFAEMRSYGEGFIVAEQTPTKLASDILKNTNLKVVHKLASSDDRRVVAESLGLSEGQTRFLSSLGQGIVVTQLDEAEEPVLCRIKSLTDHLPGGPQVPTPSLVEQWVLRKHEGCSFCRTPCNQFHLVERLLHTTTSDGTLISNWPSNRLDDLTEAHPTAEYLAQMESVLWELLCGNAQNVQEAYGQWLLRVSKTLSESGYTSLVSNSDLLYCAAIDHAKTVLTKWLAARMAFDATGPLSAPYQLQREALLGHAGQVLRNLVDRAHEIEEFKKRSLAIKDEFSEPPSHFKGSPFCHKCQTRCLLLPVVQPQVYAIMKTAGVSQYTEQLFEQQLTSAVLQIQTGGANDRRTVISDQALDNCLRAGVHAAR